jgi:uncharacterized protein with GYD domain
VGNDSQVTRNREVGVSRYLIQGRYTDTGLEGLLAVGGTSRHVHFEQNVSNLDGSVEAFYYAFGGEDIYAIVTRRAGARSRRPPARSERKESPCTGRS